MILSRVRNNPLQCAQTIFHGGGGRRNAGKTIFDIHHRPAHLQPRDDRHESRFFGATGPAATMDVEDGGLGTGCISPLINIQLVFIIIFDKIG